MSLYLRGKVWWCRGRHRGIRYWKSTEQISKAKAREWEAEFIASMTRGEYRVGVDTVTFEQLAQLVSRHYSVEGLRSGATREYILRRLAEYFRGVRAIDITPAVIEAFKEKRLKDGAAKATINADLSALSLGFRLAVKQGLLLRKPEIPQFNVSDNVRQGFVAQGDYEAIRKGLPACLADLVDFLWWTGLRLGTGRQLQWRDIAHVAQMEEQRTRNAQGGGSTPLMGSTIRIRGETTKTNVAHEIPIVGPVAGIIARATTYRRLACPYVFHRDGKPILKNWAEVQWKSAATAVGMGHIRIHDLRRSFVRNMRLLGEAEATIMSFTGHRTREIFLRYNIVDPSEQRDALERLQTFMAGESKEPTVRKIK